MLFHYGTGGSLTCEIELPGLTQPLDDLSSAFYGGQHFLAESMNHAAARKIAESLGGILVAPLMQIPPELQLPPSPPEPVSWCSCFECMVRRNPEA